MTSRKTEGNAIGHLLTSHRSIPPETRVEEVADLFSSDHNIDALAVVKKGAPCGMASRGKVLSILFNRFGFELYGRDPIMEIADPDPLTLVVDTPLEKALERAMARDFTDIYDEIVVVDERGGIQRTAFSETDGGRTGKCPGAKHY